MKFVKIPRNLVIFIILVLQLQNMSCKNGNIYIDITGFTHCTFHLTKLYPNFGELWDSILNSNQQGQPWKIKDGEGLTKKRWWVTWSQNYLHRGQRCTADFTLCNRCYSNRFLDVFEGRNTYPESFVFVIVPRTTVCEPKDFTQLHYMRATAIIIKISDTLSMTELVLVLVSPTLRIRFMNYLHARLSDLDYVSKLRNHGLDGSWIVTRNPYLASEYHVAQLQKCSFTRRNTYLVNLDRADRIAGCLVLFVLLEEIAKHYNSTVVYKLMINTTVEKLGFPTVFEPIITGVTWLFEALQQMYVEVLGTEYSHEQVTYCTRRPKRRRNFDSWFWFVPFDYHTWSLFGCTLVLYNIRWPKAQKHKIILSFCFLVIQIHYDSLLSSLITAPPPFENIRTLRELIFTHGYKLWGDSLFSEVSKEAYLFGVVEQTDLKEAEANQTMANLSLVDQNRKAQEKSPQSIIESMFRPEWKIARLFESFTAGENRIHELEPTYQKHDNKIHCHALRVPVIVTRSQYSFEGYARKELAFAFKKLYESGIYSRIKSLRKFDNWILVYKSRQKIASLDMEPIALAISDWKVLSTFMILISLESLALTTFVVEVVRMRRLANQRGPPKIC